MPRDFTRIFLSVLFANLFLFYFLSVVVILGIFHIIQPSFVDAITREEAVQYALEHSETVRISRESAAVLKESGKQAIAFIKPQLSMSTGYTELGNNIPENPFYDIPNRDISMELQLSQMIYAGGRIKNSLELNKKMEIQSELVEAIGIRDIKKQVQMAFDIVLVREATVNILKDRLKQRQNELEDAKDLKDVGMVTSLDVRQAQLSLNFAEEELHAAQTAYQEALIDFNLAIGKSVDQKLLIPDGRLDDPCDINFILNQLDEKYTNHQLIDYQLAKSKADLASVNYEIVQGQRLPEIAIVSSAKSNGQKIDELNESWQIGIYAKWNIFDGDLVRSRTISARSEQIKAQEQLHLTQKTLAGEIQKIKENIHLLESRIALQQDSVELSRKNYEDARGHYRAGTFTLTQVGDFNLAYAEARFNLMRLFFMRREQLNRAQALLDH